MKKTVATLIIITIMLIVGLFLSCSGNKLENWEQNDNTNSNVSPRWGHKMVSLGDGKVFMFGGFDNNTKADSYIYDTNQNSWEKLQLKGDTEINVNTLFNSYNYSITKVKTETGAKLIRFGGLNGNLTNTDYTTTTWEYYVNDNVWRIVFTYGIPTQRFDATINSVDTNNAYLFGGQTINEMLLNDLWKYNVKEKTWIEIEGNSDLPQKRAGHSAHFVGNNAILVFGGRGENSTYLNDTWEYNITTNEWREIKFSDDATIDNNNNNNSPVNPSNQNNTNTDDGSDNDAPPSGNGKLPPPRRNHSSVYIESKNLIVIAGGYNDTGYLSDVWSYDIDKKLWTQHNTPTELIARSNHSMAYIEETDKIIIFGGKSESGSLNDLWTFSLK
jgi:hypothetical protein